MTNIYNRMNFNELLAFYHNHLLEDIIPFWTKYAIDWEYGGIYTGINDDGSLNTTNKYIWSNARAIYTFSALYNYVERDKKWLAIATNIFEFCLKYGRIRKGSWGFLVDRYGKMLEGDKAIQVDAFAIMGLTEYAKATGDKRAIDVALETFYTVKEKLSQPGSYGTFPYPIPEKAKAHRDYFQFAFAFFNLGIYLNRADIIEEAEKKANAVMNNFRFPEKEILLEYVSINNNQINSPAGRVMNPGHAIESMWFMIHIFEYFDDKDKVREAIETIRWAMEKGWDKEYGGLFLAIDVAGKEPVYWKHAETKIWWVFAEALYALLLAYEKSNESWCIDWYWKTHEWVFNHFPNKDYGEWNQKLDRKGNKINTIIALPVKDPFHLPRALILCIDILKKITKKGERSK
ncbi:MAG: AGE family epimerase/isomerase [Spirochaetales bacterium]|nr:AGE family epimerase/isomerase [Spirochaetales bacterium]